MTGRCREPDPPRAERRRCYLRESDLGLRWEELRLTKVSNHTRRELTAAREDTFCVWKMRFHFSYCLKSQVKNLIMFYMMMKLMVRQG